METRQVVANYAYDASGNKTLERPPGSGKGTEKVYDLAGRVTTEIDPTGAVKRYAYDYAGNLTREIVVETDGQNTWDITATHAYDPLSRETSVTRPNPNNPDAPIITTYTYGKNTKTAATTSQGQQAKVIDYAYDPAGRLLTEAKHYEGGVATTSHASDLCGNETSLSEPGQPEKTKEYDLGGRLTRTTALSVALGEKNPQGNYALSNLTIEEYTYTPAGKKATSKAPYGAGKPWEGALTTFTYDGLGRELRQVQELTGDDAVTTHTWEYVFFVH